MTLDDLRCPVCGQLAVDTDGRAALRGAVAGGAGTAGRAGHRSPGPAISCVLGRVQADPDVCYAIRISAELQDDAGLATEQDRWQRGIFDELCRHLPPGRHKHQVDGSGCDSGDPLDESIAEIGEVLCWWTDHADELRRELDFALGRISALADERDEAQSNYRFMVERAADRWLDGYRELGASAAAAENAADGERVRVARLAAERDEAISA